VIKFTKDEKIVIIFLLAGIFIGTAVLYYKRLYPNQDKLITFNENVKAVSEKVNINTANTERLSKLKGIGPVLARRIIVYREKYGSFTKAEDVENVKGIGPKIFENIRKQIILKDDYAD